MPQDNVPVRIEDIEAAPVSLESQAGPQTAQQYTDLLNRFTTVTEENIGLKAEIDTLKEKISTDEILDGLIEPYAKKAYRFMCFYCVFAGVLLVASGASWWGFALPEEVLKILVGSTAVTVIGLVGMVLTGIFVGARKRS